MITTLTEQVTATATGRAGEPVLPDSLVVAALAGDARARERLIAEIHPRVLRYCRGRLGCQDSGIGSAQDVAQEVCLAVLTGLPSYTPTGRSFYAFVYGIAAHKVIDVFRVIGRNRTDPWPELPETTAPHDAPEQRLLTAELGHKLGALLERLTPSQREVIVLRVVVGLSAEQTAQAVGSTAGAVRVAQHRALNRLRDLIELTQSSVIPRQRGGWSAEPDASAAVPVTPGSAVTVWTGVTTDGVTAPVMTMGGALPEPGRAPRPRASRRQRVEAAPQTSVSRHR